MYLTFYFHSRAPIAGRQNPQFCCHFKMLSDQIWNIFHENSERVRCTSLYDAGLQFEKVLDFSWGVKLFEKTKFASFGIDFVTNSLHARIQKNF